MIAVALLLVCSAYGFRLDQIRKIPLQPVLLTEKEGVSGTCDGSHIPQGATPLGGSCGAADPIGNVCTLACVSGWSLSSGSLTHTCTSSGYSPAVSNTVCVVGSGAVPSSTQTTPTAPAYTGVRRPIRNLQFVNKCPYTVWPGSQVGAGVTPPLNGGWEMAAGSTQNIQVADTLTSGRFWGRTGCSWTSSTTFQCNTGDCNRQGNNGFQCNGGAPDSASWVELTLGGPNGVDWYDLSLVDGYNLPVAIEAENYATPCDVSRTCPGFSMSTCPPELVRDGSCLSICHALVYHVDVLGDYRNFPLLAAIVNNNQRHLVCCDCACSSSCPNGCDDSTCLFGCSPYATPTSLHPMLGGRCDISAWPTDNGQRWDQPFRNACIQAYTWQFDEGERKTKYPTLPNPLANCYTADYKITFCP